MVNAVLVDQRITDGYRLLCELDRRRILIDTCAWIYDAEAESWDLALSSPLTREFGLRPILSAIANALSGIEAQPGLSLLDVTVRRDSESLPLMLREYGRMYAVAGRSLVHTVVAGRYIERAFVYRSFFNIRQYREYYIADELVLRRDTAYGLRMHAYPPVRSSGTSGAALVAQDDLPAFSRTLGITADAAAPRRLLDTHGYQPRVWAYLSERGQAYMRRLIDLILDRRLRQVGADHEQLLSAEAGDFAFAELSDDQLAASEFGAMTPG